MFMKTFTLDPLTVHVGGALTSCEQLPCSRNHHHSAFWVFGYIVKTVDHLTRRKNSKTVTSIHEYF